MKLRCVLLLLVACAARADQWAPNLTLATTWNDNVSNANRTDDRIGALQFSGDVLANERYSLGRLDAAHFGFHASAEWWPRFGGLFTGSAGARLDWQHKFGLGALAPVFSVELAGDGIAAQESGRAGSSAGVTLALRKRFNDRWRALLTQEFAATYARAAVFDRDGAQTTAQVSYDMNEAARVTVDVFYRDGDIVSYATPPRPDIVAIAPNRMPVSTFGRAMVAYSVRAETLGTKLAYIRALTQDSALIVSYEARRTERAPLRYVNQLVSLALVRQF